MWEDREDQMRLEYATCGSFVGEPEHVGGPTYRFPIPEEVGLSFGTFRINKDNAHQIKPFKETYATFDEFMEGEHELERDTNYRRYGRWTAPEGRWDFYSIGGRWSGHLEDAKGTARDWVRYGDLDFDKMYAKARENAAHFHEDLTRYLAQAEKGGQPRYDSEEHGARLMAFDRGFVYFVEEQDKPTVRAHQRVISRRDNKGWEVYDLEPIEVFVDRYARLFHPLQCGGILDTQGWFEANDGYDYDQAQMQRARDRHTAMLIRLLTNTDRADDILVMVDIHR